MTENKHLFIISPIGGVGSDTRIYFDKVKKYLINYVCSDYVCIRADDIEIPGRITSQIIDKIIDSDIIVADLSELNPNVLYELAIAHAAEKPVILIATHNTNIPFDIAQERIVFYSLDPEDLEIARNKLIGFINSVESNNYKVDSPIKSKINIQRTGVVTDEDLLRKMDFILEMIDREKDPLKKKYLEIKDDVAFTTIIKNKVKDNIRTLALHHRPWSIEQISEWIGFPELFVRLAIMDLIDEGKVYVFDSMHNTTYYKMSLPK